ncbi:S8 family serine peptidase [Pontiellaceae bacterium B12227]|nr:S8 family serine peptidase [Pontiellaceae bacterium B12227]
MRIIVLSLSLVASVTFAQESNQESKAGQTNRYTRAMSVQDAKTMKDARKKRSDILSKRHDMKDRQTRGELVRQLRELETERMAAVQRRAVAGGWKIQGKHSDGRGFRLIDFDEKGFPVYEEDMNVQAATTTGADEVRDSATFQSSVQVEAELAYPDNHSGIQLETCTDTGGGQNIAYIDNGDWVEYSIDIPAAGQYSINVRTASKNSGTINLSANGTSIGSVEVPDTNGWQAWTTVRTHVFFAAAGTQTLRMDFVGDGSSLFNVNWFSYNRTVMIGQWETGTPRLTHQELSGKVAVWDSDDTDTSDHATHVAGTMVSRGINAATLGMAPEASVASFDSGNATAEMTANGAAAPGTTNLYLSNHSYGISKGWYYYESGGYWTFRGTFVDDDDPSTDYAEDFGRYASRSVEWDGIAYNLPYYLIFKSAGNERTDVPKDGATWKDGWTSLSYDSTKHPAGDGEYKDGWDNMTGAALSKNLITVGASDAGVDGSGNRDPQEASAVSFSSRGPTDDGRIKPDLHGNGTSVISSTAGSDTSTGSYQGTSMSSPNCCGSAALLIDYYTSRCSGSMRASTLKALILHTADDRGKTGPDYKYGWGIMNTQAAADVIKAHADNVGGGAMIESSVSTGITSRSRTFNWDGTSPLRVTLCWTDPPATEMDGHDNRTKALVNDLNLKVIGPGGTHYPYVTRYVANGGWVVSNIDKNATTGINDVDNVEQVYLAAPTAGDYTIIVDYAGTLTNGEQIYSLVVTGNSAAELTELEEWRSDYFGTTFGAGDTADDADYDEDGLVNLMEFGLATAPIVLNSDPVIFSVDSSDAELTFPRNLSSTNDYDLEVIWSDNLLSNNWSTMSVIENILSESGSVQQVESSLPVGDSTNRYFRLRMNKK